jgi:hypothetical protein
MPNDGKIITPQLLISDPGKWVMIKCGFCDNVDHWRVLINITGVICWCQGCNKKYKLESDSGVKILDA